jgi:hypothetical protein
VQNLACYPVDVTRQGTKPRLFLGSVRPSRDKIETGIFLPELAELAAGAAGAAGAEHSGNLVGFSPNRFDCPKKLGQWLRVVVGDNPFNRHIEQLGPGGDKQTVCENGHLETCPNKLAGKWLDVWP